MNKILSFLVSVFFLLISNASNAQNKNSWWTLPVSEPAALLFPHNRFVYENDLMNHISDELRLDDNVIRNDISCDARGKGTIIHRGSRGLFNNQVLPIQCKDKSVLEYARAAVSRMYKPGIGHNLKYAFKSGPYVFAVCNYDNQDSHASHSHHDGHYVCRVPASGESMNGNIETFCYEMGYFHRTCNPHKALVATEIITINSIARWEAIDKTILIRFIANKLRPLERALEIVDDLRRASVTYNTKKRGSPDAVSRYPKIFRGVKYACIEHFETSGSKYVNTKIDCGDIKNLTFNKIKHINLETIKENLVFSSKLSRLKQRVTSYPMLRGMNSSVDE